MRWTVAATYGITGRVFFLQEDVPNGGLADAGWPTAMHDHYLSNNAAHPFRWDRSGEPPYPGLDELLAETPPCWNEADWDFEECGPLPDPTAQGSDGGDGGDADAGDTGTEEDVDDSDADGHTAEDITEDTPEEPEDTGEAEDTSAADGGVTPSLSGSGGCDGCSSSCTSNSQGGQPDPLAIFLAAGVIGLLQWCKRRG